MQLSLQLSKLQGTTSYFDGNMGRVGVKSDTVLGQAGWGGYHQTAILQSLLLYSLWMEQVLLIIGPKYMGAITPLPPHSAGREAGFGAECNWER